MRTSWFPVIPNDSDPFSGPGAAFTTLFSVDALASTGLGSGFRFFWRAGRCSRLSSGSAIALVLNGALIPGDTSAIADLLPSLPRSAADSCRYRGRHNQITSAIARACTPIDPTIDRGNRSGCGL